MTQSRHTYRTAFRLAMGISLALNVILLLMYFHIRTAAMQDDVELENWPITTHKAIKIFIFTFVFNFVYSFTLYVLNFKVLSAEFKPIKSRFLLLGVTVATALFFTLSVVLIFKTHGEYKPFVSMNVIIAGYILLSSQLKYLSDKQQQTALENRTLLAENIRTRYEVLKNQVDPHFLFNSLNTLNTLIAKDAEKAQQYVQELSNVFRYTLQNKEIISLDEELKFTQAYCHLMQIRYGDSLRFEYQIDPRFNTYNIIPLSLQILVENAIKHNVVSTKHPLTISLTTADNGSISVSNAIQPKKDIEKGEGIGLANLAERYRLMYQREIVITQKDGFFSVEICLIT